MRFQVKSWGKFLFWLLLGVLYIVAGFVTFENPLLAAALLTLMLGGRPRRLGHHANYSCLQHERGDAPGFWVVLSSVITLLLGIVILAHWPVSSLYISRAFPRYRSHLGGRLAGSVSA